MNDQHDTQDLSPEMVLLAQATHDIADKLWDTEAPADIMHRLRTLADDIQQLTAR